MTFFFNDPHLFPYYPYKCLHNEFTLPTILPVYQLARFELLNGHLNKFCLHYRLW